MEGPSLLGFGSIPTVLRYAKRCARASPEELLLDRLHSPLETQGVLEGVVRESDFAIRFAHACEQELNSLLLRAACKWPAAHGRKHLGTPVVVGDRDHFLHEAYAQWGHAEIEAWKNKTDRE